MSDPKNDPMSKLIEFMQRAQASYRSLYKSATGDTERSEAQSITGVIGDFIRYAAELRGRDEVQESIIPSRAEGPARREISGLASMVMDTMLRMSADERVKVAQALLLNTSMMVHPR